MIRAGTCWSYKLELHKGIHNFLTDIIKVALYTADASLAPETTTVYVADNGATDTNWPAGGKQLAVSSTYPKLDTQGRSVVKFNDLSVASLTLSFRGLLIYNSSKANRAILIIDKGVDIILTA